MSRLVGVMIAAACLLGLAGCCASPYRAFQNAYGFNDPVPDWYPGGIGNPKTTPPGPTAPAMPSGDDKIY